jgi:hypothetical protein
MTSTGAPSIDAILDRFLQQPMKIQGLLNYHNLNSLHQQLYRNANSFSCSLGGGNHGYLGMLMSVQNIWPPQLPTTSPAPVFPGYLPAAISRTAAVMADLVRVHNKDLHKWNEYDNVTKALQKQILNTVEPDFIVHLKDEFSSYNNIKINNLLDYLFMAYGNITSTNLIKHNQTFDQEWDTSRLFQTILARIKQCCDYAANGDQLYTDKQILARLHAIVFHTGLYHEALKKWMISQWSKKTSIRFPNTLCMPRTTSGTKRHAGTEWQ